MKPRNYCCCAIPTVYAGIYTTLLEQFALGILAGTLSIATPQIVGASTPSIAKWVFAIICYVGAAIQVLGFIAVHKEKPIMYRRYATLHLLVTLAAFAIAGVWIGLSASRHAQAKSKCIADFFKGPESTSLADTMCNIFPWVDIGIMAGLWVLLAIAQLYFYIIVSSYGTGQRFDHEKYDSMYDATNPLTSNAPLNNQWGIRPSDENLLENQPRGYHSRHGSGASVASVLNDKQPQYGSYESYPSVQPGNPYTQNPGPTPRAHDSYYYNTEYQAAGMGQPERAQPHPGAL
jgi:hypothetical protein